MNAAAQAFIAAAAIFFLYCSPISAAQITILHSFADGTVPNDGAYPAGQLIQASNGNFYGATVGTGLNPDGDGTIFQMPIGGSVSTVYTFTGPNLSATGQALLFYNNALVGTTGSGGYTTDGTELGFGTIFSTELSGKTTFLHKFTKPVAPDSGAIPSAGLVLGADGEFYGTTTRDGNTSGGGIAFKINPKTGALTELSSISPYSLTGSLLLGQDGNFYGITAGATIIKMTPAGVITNLYTFSGITYGSGSLIQDASGNFYGVVGDFGAYANGAVFKMTPQYIVTILYAFGKAPDGSGPFPPVIGSDGNLYGTTNSGGTAGGGVVYELSTDGSTYSILHNFGDGSVQNDGNEPSGSLVLGSDNKLYGVTEGGGSADLGAIYRLSP